VLQAQCALYILIVMREKTAVCGLDGINGTKVSKNWSYKLGSVGVG
jgi:hypothetical protein